MTQDEYARKLEELDHLLNDPDVAMDSARVWSLLADLSGRDSSLPSQGASQAGTGLGAAAAGDTD
ncbi:MAG TPA: peptide chain release factor 1 [Acetobacteraceae bacterium]|nr:peptide chain release factor 1 [Acetobacteraceae bacterium]